MTKPWHPVPEKGIARISHRITKRKKKEAKKKEKHYDYDIAYRRGTPMISQVGPNCSPMWVHFSCRLPSDFGGGVAYSRAEGPRVGDSRSIRDQTLS